MGTNYSITEQFGANLAKLLAEKIGKVYPEFDAYYFIYDTDSKTVGQSYTQRVATLAELLRSYLPADYKEALPILMAILGEENPNETGMFTHYYWILPIGKFVQEYGIDHFDISMKAIEEITKRNTGEYAVRPYIRKYPEASLEVIEKWANSPNFHLRRLASEGLRPKLPWASKMDTFIENPRPVFQILELLKEDEVLFVKKSVANHITDWLKVNREAVLPLIERWKASENRHTQWIIKRATRKIQ
ncbi:DNA alkylation repair protein [Prevotella intermedia]|uniref:3-methyladenine DNA glycosylase n=1 Tax=Prevotella intermedia TaxID=28131 RepID=A0A2D3LKG2_PREIN|nr:DNA alkylation repair protein [Prevotella intermedia]ATV31019.1 3-methyladenine DNA glycosylase [Prevotella intermedia]PJI22733.1 3-methyladenine DNA glycosylase [Prevotella intermedia]